MTIINCYYHPTKVLFLDDSKTFLQAINAELLPDHHLYEFFTFPHDFLHLLNHEYEFSPYTNRYIQLIDEMAYQHRRIDVDICRLHHEVYTSNRFGTISAVVIDYDIPLMNGLEICKNIENEYIQKILLTGVSDEHLAVEASNQGLIQGFVKKQDPNMITKLKNILLQCQQRYFYLLSQTIMHIIHSDKKRVSAISDPIFIELFHSLIK